MRRPASPPAVLILLASLCLLTAIPAQAQLDFEKAPINYGQAETHDPVALLSQAIDEGRETLEYSEEHGWLPSVLEKLQVSPDTQTMVFSKTSLQLHKISPRTPRALYFNDDVYVGWCQHGDVVELAATDPEQGAVFYTIDQDPSQPPKIVRDRGQCLTCHATNRTQGVPGYLVRSVYSDNNGRPRSGTRTYVTDHSTGIDERFGGWYVTGLHGNMRHMGNVFATDRSDPENIDREAGSNRRQLEELFDTTPYLRPTSDIVALMVLEHQTQMHNFIARASFETRIAGYYDRGINEALERPEDTVSPSTGRRIAAAGEALVRYMLFADEIKFECPIESVTKFTESFQSPSNPQWHGDAQGRSLRQLELSEHLFKYPCSYLIYTDAFDALPAPMMKYVKERMTEILTAKTTPEGFERLTDADRLAIREILAETKPGFLIEASL